MMKMQMIQTLEQTPKITKLEELLSIVLSQHQDRAFTRKGLGIPNGSSTYFTTMVRAKILKIVGTYGKNDAYLYMRNPEFTSVNQMKEATRGYWKYYEKKYDEQEHDFVSERDREKDKEEIEELPEAMDIAKIESTIQAVNVIEYILAEKSKIEIDLNELVYNHHHLKEEVRELRSKFDQIVDEKEEIEKKWKKMNQKLQTLKLIDVLGV